MNFVGAGSGVYALALDSLGNLYAGGDFTSAGGVEANYVAEWNGSAWSALGTGMSGGTASSYVNTLACDSAGNLFAGSGFTQAGGLAANYVAEWVGSTWSALGSGMSGSSVTLYVFTLAFDGRGNLYAGGDFTTAGGFPSTYIAEDVINGGSTSGGIAQQLAVLEAALGGTPPYGSILTGPSLPLVLNKLDVQLNFGFGGRDSLVLSGKLAVPAGLALNGQSVVVDAGGIIKIFTLDVHGQGVSSPGIGGVGLSGPNDHFRLRLKSSNGQAGGAEAVFAANFNQGNFSSVLSTQELVGNVTVNNVLYTMPVIVIFGGQLFEVEEAVVYNVAAGGVREHRK